MKKLTLATASLLAASLLTACGNDAADTNAAKANNATAEKPIVIKFSHVVAENTPKGQGAILFEQLAEEKTGGRVDVQIFPNGQLYNDKAVLVAVLKNDVQMAAPSLSKFSKFTKALQIYDLPFLFNDLDAVDCFQGSAGGKAMLDSMQDKGIKGLTYWHNGMKQLSATKPLRTPADAEGLKFRIMSSDVLQRQFQAVNANPQKLSFSEVYLALQTGTVDGQENTWSNIYSKKFHEVQAHISVSNHGLLDYMVVTSDKFWASLPDDIRAQLEEALTEATTEANKLASAKNKKARSDIEASRVTQLIELSDEQKALWRNAMKPVWDEFAPQIGADYIQQAAACN